MKKSAEKKRLNINSLMKLENKSLLKVKGGTAGDLEGIMNIIR